MRLLARVGEQLYWAARYMERAEGTARVVREHTNILVDMPTSVPLTWEPLLAMTGESEAFADTGAQPDEAAVVRFLVGDADNPGSIAASIARARDNLRGCREIVPAEAWGAVNELHLHMRAHRTEDVDRRSRARLLGRVIDEHLRFLGIVISGMTRDTAFTMMRLGRHVERACLTTRVLDVRAEALLDPAVRGRYDDVQWIGVLRSLAALHMYHRRMTEPVSPAPAMRFLLREPTFPRSVAYCLTSILQTAGQLPRGEDIVTAAAGALDTLDALDPEGASPEVLRVGAQTLAAAVEDLHDRILRAYFPPATV